MSNTRFTKGPWLTDNCSEQSWVISESNGSKKAICKVTTFGLDDNSLRDSNAHLMAAAPEMYEALECMANILKAHYGNATELHLAFNHNDADHLLMLLARARGEQ